jgi:hypothetical protein
MFLPRFNCPLNFDSPLQLIVRGSNDKTRAARAKEEVRPTFIVVYPKLEGDDL